MLENASKPLSISCPQVESISFLTPRSSHPTHCSASFQAMSKGGASAVYAERLTRFKHGHPLWYPEPLKGPGGNICDIQLGDVGYVNDYGGFQRLFNIIVEVSDEINAGGVPSNFAPVRFNRNALQHEHGEALEPGTLCSEGVECRELAASITGSAPATAGAEISYSFHCSSHEGAFLVMSDHATHSWIERNIRFRKYMLKHHRSWYAFAIDPETVGIDRPPEDIVLVLGTMKTSAWTVGAFLARDDHVHSFTVGAQAGTVAGARVQVSSERNESQTCQQRSGPHRQPRKTSAASPSVDPLSLHRLASDAPDSTTQNNTDELPPPKDQCIFLRYYKIKYRTFWPKKIVANADPSSLDKDTDDSDDLPTPATDADVELDPEFIPPRSPLDDILDYILEYSPDAEVAITSHDDVADLFPDRDAPVDITSVLREIRPRIIVDQSKAGYLSLDVNEDASDASSMTGSHHSTIHRSQSRQSDDASWCSRSSNRSRERFSRSRSSNRSRERFSRSTSGKTSEGIPLTGGLY